MKIFIYWGNLHGHDTTQKVAPWPCPDCFLVQTNLSKKLILTQGNEYMDVYSMNMYLISISFILSKVLETVEIYSVLKVLFPLTYT